MPTRRANLSTYLVWPAIAALLFSLYVLSSGPVIASAFWLREITDRDEFYLTAWLYYPILALGRDNLMGQYIEWWVVDVFGTVGPG